MNNTQAVLLVCRGDSIDTKLVYPGRIGHVTATLARNCDLYGVCYICFASKNVAKVENG